MARGLRNESEIDGDTEIRTLPISTIVIFPMNCCVSLNVCPTVGYAHERNWDQRKEETPSLVQRDRIREEYTRGKVWNESLRAALTADEKYTQKQYWGLLSRALDTRSSLFSSGDGTYW